ncbi:Calmodulin-dependent protein kinase [Spraguea lophii 42_110]|uniref:Calmodulin-dependent protein kinase n=1 Tax=Spraguea lophii (strain 42_110) TaxID=1358809 RepID=S7W6F1_SPRLO|nr:Calmodulin-dependent protein kinase [Spraguea lophii 42_110]
MGKHMKEEYTSLTSIYKCGFRRLTRKNIIRACIYSFISVLFFYLLLNKRRPIMRLEEECLDFINESVDECLKFNTRPEQNKCFSEIQTTLPLQPIKMTQLTAVFLYTGEKIPVVIKRVIVKKEVALNEDKISMQLKNKYIIRHIKTRKKYFVNHNGVEQEITFLFSEYLSTKITQRNVSRNEDKIRAILKDALKGLDYMHQKKIAHLDLKIANIMGNLENGKIIYKLIDFGYSRVLPKKEIYIEGKSYGTYPYKPPEVIFDHIHGLKSDIWCMGAIAWFLSLGRTPFYTEEGEKAPDKYKKFLLGKIKHVFNTNTSAELQDFILKAMNRNKDDRPTVTELLKHPFLTKQMEYNYSTNDYLDSSS